MIHQSEGGFVLSSCRVWRPGVFETLEAAQEGEKLEDEAIQILQERAIARGGRRCITIEDVRKLNDINGRP